MINVHEENEFQPQSERMLQKSYKLHLYHQKVFTTMF